jgi:predicted metal-dependent phosphoesterase TrpH
VKEVVKHSEKHMDAIAITDHNTFRGYKKAKQMKPNIILVPGIEISTDNGHLMCFGIEELKFKIRENIFDVIDRVHSSGGVTVVSHPFRPLKRHVHNFNVFKKIDAIEIINGNTLPKYNLRAFEVSKQYKKPRTAGSDAHRLKDIGSFSCTLKGHSSDDVLKAIKKNRLELPKNNTTWVSIASKIVERRATKYKRKIFG